MSNIKAKFITSIILGLIIPWLYFIFVTVGTVKTFDQEGNVLVGPNGLASFIEFNGFLGSLAIYSEAIAISGFLVFCVCTLYEIIAEKSATQP